MEAATTLSEEIFFKHLIETYTCSNVGEKNVVLCRIDNNPDFQEAEYAWIEKVGNQIIKAGDYVLSCFFGEGGQPIYRKKDKEAQE